MPVNVSHGDIPAGVKIVQIAAGGLHTVSIGDDGNVYSWGYNGSGRLGDETTTNRSSPVKVSQGAIPTSVKIVQITAGYHHTVALGDDGNVYSWGSNGNGQLGDGTTIRHLSPVKVSQGVIPVGVKIVQIVSGRDYTMGLGNNGVVYFWGYDYSSAFYSSSVNRPSAINPVRNIINGGGELSSLYGGFVDRTPPSINAPNHRLLVKNSYYYPGNYITVSDNADSSPSKVVTPNSIVTDVAKSVNVTTVATDASGNSRTTGSVITVANPSMSLNITGNQLKITNDSIFNMSNVRVNGVTCTVDDLNVGNEAVCTLP